MTHAKFHAMTIEQLVDHFVTIGLAQQKAIDWDDHATFRRLYSKMEDVRRELKTRSGDQRRALLPLLDHPSPQVRLKAAITTLAVAPQASRQTLQLIWDRNEFPQAADAFGMIRALDKGTYVPE
jgi:hypothetical protein